MAVYAINPSIWEIGAGRFREFKATLRYRRHKIQTSATLRFTSIESLNFYI